MINTDNLSHNVRRLRDAAGKHFFCPMIKADAYGHGALSTAQVLIKNGVSRMGVALIEEGVELRQAGIQDAEIFVFGPFAAEGAKAVVQHGLIPVLSRWDQLESLAVATSTTAAAKSAPLSVHLKFNTGMNRLGFDVKDATRLETYFSEHKQLGLSGICTHLAMGEDAAAGDGMTHTQLQAFKRAEQAFQNRNILMHVYNSAGFLSRFGHLNIESGFRPGISLYGEPGVETDGVKLKPVMTLQSEILMFHHLKPGESVSYGARWTAQRPSVVAVVAIGYADGLNRRFSNTGFMLYRGNRVPIIGTVCMDYTLIDLTDAVRGSPPQIGEEVVVFGEQRGQYLRASECASMIGTIAYEIFTSVSRRVPRVYVTGDSK